MPRKGPLSFILESFNRRGYYISKRKECVLVFNGENSLLTLSALRVISIKFLLVVPMYCKTVITRIKHMITQDEFN